MIGLDNAPISLTREGAEVTLKSASTSTAKSTFARISPYFDMKNFQFAYARA